MTDKKNEIVVPVAGSDDAEVDLHQKPVAKDGVVADGKAGQKRPIPVVAGGLRHTDNPVFHGIPGTVPTGEVTASTNGPARPRLNDVQATPVRREPVADLPAASHVGAHARPAEEDEKEFSKRRKARREAEE